MIKSLITALLFSTLLCTLPAVAETLRPVTLQLKWHHRFEFAGYYAALEKGYYREAGIELILKEGGPQRSPIQDVSTGAVDFGIASSELLVARAEGKPVVAVAVILQHSPLVVMAHHDNNIHSLHDMVGKEIRAVPHDREVDAMLLTMGHRANNFILTPRSDHDLDDLMAGRIAAVAGYIGNEPYLLEQSGIEVMQLTPRMAGIDFYGDTLFTSSELIESSPRMVEAFRQATLKGWQYAVSHPEEIAELISRRYAPHMERKQLLHEANQISSLIMPQMVDIGYMSETRWEHILNTYRELGLLSGEVPLKEFVYDPHPYRDLTWLYLTAIAGFLSALLVGGIGFYITRLNRRLHESEHNYRMLAEHAFDVIWTFDITTGRFTYVSPAVQRMRGLSVNEAMAQRLAETFTPASLAQIERAMAELQNGADLAQHQWELEQYRKDGTTLWTDTTITLVRDHEGRPSEIVGITRDISEQRLLREDLQSLSVAIEAAAESVMITSREGVIQYVNPAFTRMTGYSAEEAIGKRPSIVKSGIHDTAFYKQLWKTILGGDIWQGELTNRNRRGELYIESAAISPVLDSDGTILHFVAIKHDITVRKALEARLDRLAHFDTLTEVPNRQLFFLRLEQSLELMERNQQQMALLFIDLDGFKAVNDTYGHKAGDSVLRCVARRLGEVVRDSDTVARVGGDEFVVLLTNIRAVDNLAPIIAKLLDSLSRAIECEGHSCHIGASIGVSLYPDHSRNAAELLTFADSAMYMSKQAGKNRWSLYQP